MAGNLQSLLFTITLTITIINYYLLKIVKKNERYLAEYWWRGLNKTDNIFDAFLRDMKLCFVDP
jgi:hypothetical protein